jgi:hypothetical protein
MCWLADLSSIRDALLQNLDRPFPSVHLVSPEKKGDDVSHTSYVLAQQPSRELTLSSRERCLAGPA